MNMKNRLTILSAIPPLIMMGTVAYDRYAAEPARHHDYWRVPTKQPVPQSLQEAGRLSSEIDRHEATWTAEMDELTKLIEGQKPGEFHLSDEIATADAFSAYVAHLLRAGESAVETFVKMQGTVRELNQLLQAAPAIFRESAPPVRAASRTTPRGRTSSRTTRSSPISMRRRPRPLRCIKMMSRPTSTTTSLITLKIKTFSWNVC